MMLKQIAKQNQNTINQNAVKNKITALQAYRFYVNRHITVKTGFLNKTLWSYPENHYAFCVKTAKKVAPKNVSKKEYSAYMTIRKECENFDPKAQGYLKSCTSRLSSPIWSFSSIFAASMLAVGVSSFTNIFSKPENIPYVISAAVITVFPAAGALYDYLNNWKKTFTKLASNIESALKSI